MYCYMYLTLFVGILCSSMFWYALFYVLSSFAIILTRMKDGCFAFIVILVSCYCKCPVALLHCVVGGSAVCDCVIF